MPRIITRSPSRSPRRATEWMSSGSGASVIALAGSTKAIMQSFTGAQVNARTPFTIIRTIGMLWIKSDQEAADENQFGAIGFQVLRESARAAGVASMSSPVTNANDDMWFVHQWFMTSFVFTSAAGFESNAGTRYAYDSSAQRKVQEGDAISAVIENIATTGLQFFHNFRMLIKVH